jgi:hypothetical protein
MSKAKRTLIRERRAEWLGSKEWCLYKRSDRDDYLVERQEDHKYETTGRGAQLQLMLSIVSAMSPARREKALLLYNAYADRNDYPKRVFIPRANGRPRLVTQSMACREAHERAQGAAMWLNHLLETKGMSEVLADLIERRVPVYSPDIVNHSTLQVIVESGSAQLGILGLLNGIIGVRKDSTGFLAAEYDDAGKLTKFIVREEEENKT